MCMSFEINELTVYNDFNIRIKDCKLILTYSASMGLNSQKSFTNTFRVSSGFRNVAIK